MSEEVQDDSNNTASLSLEPAGAECGATEASGAECGGTADASTDVSQTHIPQMTASPCPDNSGKWNCDFCTYENFPQSRKCTMCRSAKPLLNEDIFRLQDGASALPPPPPPPDSSVSEAEAVAERLRPLRIASPPAQAGASCVPKWPCPTCTYENWPKSLKCAMCGASSPQPAPRTQVGINDICNSQNASIQDSAELDTARRAKRKTDWLWLQACLGVVEGDISLVHSYLSGGGDPARALTPPEVALLNRASAFDAGHTLVHLAIRFQRQDILSTLLSRISGSGPGLKRSPSYIAPDLASAIRRHIASCIRTKKGSFQCRYINEFCTFSLPAEIEELPPVIQEQLFSELLDRDAQSTLEADPPLINWSRDFNDTLAGTRLYALWNRSLGDCLPDAVSQATYGVSDRERVLRAAAAASLANNRQRFYERWSTWERLQASLLHYTPDESQLLAEWTRLVAPAAAPNTPLHQLHVFALAHVIRRPIIVYGVNVVNSFRGEALGYARFQGVYLPLLWEPEFCSKWPICLGYTRGHFSALVSVEPYSSTRRYICRERPENAEVYLPLTDFEGKLLPVHFLNCEELADTEGVLRRWLSVSGRGASLTARQRLPPRPLLLAQMLEEWLNHYRRTIQQCRGPFPPRLHAAAAAELSSDPDSDEE